MASSRKSVQTISAVADVTEQFERALEAILARVVVYEPSVAIAYSGGLDSSVLLQLAMHYCRRHQIKLYSFHVHHGLSPNADEWLRHCEQQAQALGVPFDAVRIDLVDVNEAGVEQAARIARYAALGDLCRSHGARLLLTAHHQDDQAETVLLHLFRGTGLRGLSGMHDLHDENALLGEGIMLARPLLQCSRKQLEAYASELQIAHVHDESNTDIRYRRNAIRQQIMPRIDRYFPGAAATITRGAQHWQSAQQLLDQLAEIDLANCAEGNALNLSSMAALSEQRIDNLLRYWLLLQGAPYPPSTAQLSQLRMQMLDARADANPSVVLCYLQLQRHAGWLVASAIMHSHPPAGPMRVQWRGEREIEIPEWQGSLLFTQAESTGICPQRLQASALTLQPRAGGERLKPGATRPSRTLKNLFQEAALPAQQRPWLPLAYLEGQLVFAAGLGMDVRHADARGGIVLGWRGA